ncbi:MAG: manganese efflux pump MntP family protein [Armatimonadota bacterium]|nr:manganese efflux pump MntP family protein [bacterium]MDW8320342.1 manganese efflux pump MntP family protein [Armatimonadota bacterium]
MLTTLFIAIGLAMDALAISISSGLKLKGLRISYALRIAAAFGLAQAVMPVIGWFAGYGAGELIADFDHWVAFGLLAAIGGRMVWDSFTREETERTLEVLHAPRLLLLAIATSLDAMAVGLGLSLLRVPILHAATLIGVITFTLSFWGVFAGDRIGRYCENKAEMIGGIVLIAIGVKMLIDHSL